METKICPLLTIANLIPGGQGTKLCAGEECAWFCGWQNACSMVAIPAELADRLGEINSAIRG